MTPPPDSPDPPERRGATRRRRRLHAARLTDETGRHLGEGLLSDVSTEGARLRLSGPADPPDRVLVFDEAGRRVARARLIWRRGGELGLRLEAWRELEELAPALRRRFLASYHAAD